MANVSPTGQQPEHERDFPDITGTSVTGRKIGVELGEWLNEEEIQSAKQKERLEDAFVNAIGNQGPNPTQHIRYVWLHPKARIASADVVRFRDQLFACILDCDRPMAERAVLEGGIPDYW